MTYKPTIPIPTSKIAKLDIETLKRYRDAHRDGIRRRLGEFRAVREAGEGRLFAELCYCILTPQSSGRACDSVLRELSDKGVLRDPAARQNELEEALKRTRFWRKKSMFIIGAWERFESKDADGLKNTFSRLQGCEGIELRNRFREEVRGMGLGMKEASHFLRNTGRGSGVAIVDRHILRCLSEMGVISEEETGIRSEADYLRVEKRMFGFSQKLGIPLEELDLLLWSSKTGYIFK